MTHVAVSSRGSVGNAAKVRAGDAKVAAAAAPMTKRRDMSMQCGLGIKWTITDAISISMAASTPPTRV